MRETFDNLSEQDYYIAASGVSGWTPRRNMQLEEAFGDWRGILAAMRREDAALSKILDPAVLSDAVRALRADAVKSRRESFQRYNIGCLTPADALYPDAVRNMGYDVPFLLTYSGNPALLSGRNIAVVGSRKSTDYGARIAREFSTALGRAGLGIVSGLAYGIDSHAHRAALDAGVPTIAVLGSGIRHITPPTHTELARQIVRSGGIVLSEFEPEFGGSGYSYPQRNRLIAALSEGVVMVEAAKGSGSVYTVDHAVEQGKEVFLIPNSLLEPNFYEVREAFLAGKGNFVVCPDDILSGLGIRTERTKRVVESRIQLDILSQKILDNLAGSALNYDCLLEKIGGTGPEILACLSRLEIFGLISSVGNVYKIVR